MYSMRVAALLIVIAWAAGCGDPAESPNARRPDAVRPSPHQTVESSDQPKFWADEKAAEMIRTQLDLPQATSTVLVVRWKNGTVDGWADFVPKEEAQRILLKTLSAPPEGAHAIWRTYSSNPEKTSGWLVVVLQRNATSADNLYQCRLTGQYTCQLKNGSATFEFVDARGTTHWGACESLDKQSLAVSADTDISGGGVKDSPTSDTSYAQFPLNGAQFGMNGHALEMVSEIAGERIAWLELTFRPTSN